MNVQDMATKFYKTNPLEMWAWIEHLKDNVFKLVKTVRIRIWAWARIVEKKEASIKQVIWYLKSWQT